MRQHQNLDKVIRVAEALGDLRGRFVFIGGSIVGCHIEDPGAPNVRHTDDVDLIVEVVGMQKKIDIEREISSLGFKHDLRSGAHAQRFRLGELIVDILATDESDFGMATPWYPLAVAEAEWYALRDDLQIRLISAPLLICTKFDAYDDRGKNDLRMSKDIGDILALVDGRPALFDDIEKTKLVAKKFICQRIAGLLNVDNLSEIFECHFDQDQLAREAIILERMTKIVSLSACEQ